MLRITKSEAPDGVTLTLEGRLGGAWVMELEDAWRVALSSLNGRPLRVDLGGVDCVDTAGKYLLALMHRTGVSLTATGCMMAALVQEVTGDWPKDCEQPGRTA